MFWCGIVCAFFSAPRLSLDDVGRDDGYDGGADVVVVLATTVVEEKVFFSCELCENNKKILIRVIYLLLTKVISLKRLLKNHK